MRFVVCSVVALAAGCSSSSMLEHQSELSVLARGVALSEDGRTAQVGMYNTTCAVSTQNAEVGNDVDFDGDEDEVLDAGWVEGLRVFAVASERGVHLQPTGQALVAEDVTLEGNFDAARVYEQGVVASVGDSLVWSTGREEVVPGLRGFELGPDGTGIAVNGEVWNIDSDGSYSTGLAADRVAFDPLYDVVLSSVDGEESLRVGSRSGESWSEVALSQTVVDMAVLGDRGQAVVVTEATDGSGGLLVVDHLRGEVVGSAWTPTPAMDVAVSGDGHTIAVDTDRAVHFFRVP